MPGQIDGDDAVVVRQFGKHISPGEQRLTDGVYQKERLSNARFQIVDARGFALFFSPGNGQFDVYKIAHLFGVNE